MASEVIKGQSKLHARSMLEEQKNGSGTSGQKEEMEQ